MLLAKVLRRSPKFCLLSLNNATKCSHLNQRIEGGNWSETCKSSQTARTCQITWPVKWVPELLKLKVDVGGRHLCSLGTQTQPRSLSCCNPLETPETSLFGNHRTHLWTSPARLPKGGHEWTQTKFQPFYSKQLLTMYKYCILAHMKNTTSKAPRNVFIHGTGPFTKRVYNLL